MMMPTTGAADDDVLRLATFGPSGFRGKKAQDYRIARCQTHNAGTYWLCRALRDKAMCDFE
ncbi:hypothetical protein [Solimonas marina]|uniref:Uncharacterized protein n=1 Tax=Solimonas marina TaxID=2714601 RepID=A0A970B512_9GAMM|nr:hypothetical protein [Solimonas marina]NKF21203.1 hypothetical protein [Solimonas marina]